MKKGSSSKSKASEPEKRVKASPKPKPKPKTKDTRPDPQPPATLYGILLQEATNMVPWRKTRPSQQPEPQAYDSDARQISSQWTSLASGRGS